MKTKVNIPDGFERVTTGTLLLKTDMCWHRKAQTWKKTIIPGYEARSIDIYIRRKPKTRKAK